MITQHRSGDNVLCPVRTWAAIIKRLASYPGASPTDTVNLFRYPDGKKHMFSGSELLKCLRLVATTLGADVLGFTAKEIGLHSARSGAAMAMYFGSCPSFHNHVIGEVVQ